MRCAIGKRNIATFRAMRIPTSAVYGINVDFRILALE
jgi:hypothetical protein